MSAQLSSAQSIFWHKQSLCGERKGGARSGKRAKGFSTDRQTDSKDEKEQNVVYVYDYSRTMVVYFSL